MVTFRPDISYSTAKRKAEGQARIITALGWWTASLGVLGGGIIGLKLLQRARIMI
jgi:kynurenine 3-monooxygenase